VVIAGLEPAILAL